MNCVVDDICWSIDNIDIIKNIRIDAEAGKITGIIGPNGSGKSTLLKNIYRVLKPQRGTVFIDGQDVFKLSSKETARQMAVVSQEGTGEFDFSVLDIVLMGRYPYKKAFDPDSPEDLIYAQTALSQTRLTGFEERSFATLSGGEKQRVMIARALAQQARIIILDEPTNHLDIGFKFQVFDIVKDTGLSIIAAVHDINLAALYCDKLYVLQKGSVTAAGPPEGILTPRLLKDVFSVNAEVAINPGDGRPRILFLGAIAPVAVVK